MASIDKLFVSRHVLRAAIETRLRCPAADSYYACVVSPISCEYLEQSLAELQPDNPDGLGLRLSALCAKIYARWATNKHAKKLANMNPSYSKDVKKILS